MVTCGRHCRHRPGRVQRSRETFTSIVRAGSLGGSRMAASLHAIPERGRRSPSWPWGPPVPTPRSRRSCSVRASTALRPADDNDLAVAAERLSEVAAPGQRLLSWPTCVFTVAWLTTRRSAVSVLDSPLGDEAEGLGLTLGELLEACVRPWLSAFVVDGGRDDGSGHGGVEQNVTACHHLDRVDELLRRGIVEQKPVAMAGSASLGQGPLSRGSAGLLTYAERVRTAW